MKRTRIYVVFVVMIILTALLGACGGQQQSPSPTESASPASAVTTTPPSESPSAEPGSTSAPSESPSPTPATAEPTPTSFRFEDKTYEDGVIIIKYPQISGWADKSVEEQLNKQIADTVLAEVSELSGDDALAAYEVVGKVSLNTPDVISVYFEGYYNYKGAAHPSQFFKSINIDVKKLEAVTLPQLVTIGADLVEKMTAGTFRSNGVDMSSEYEAAVRDYLTGMDADYWVQALNDADKPGYEIWSYLTEDALGISVGVPHALGDHVEVLIKYSDLQGLQTDNPLWQALEK